MFVLVQVHFKESHDICNSKKEVTIVLQSGHSESIINLRGLNDEPCELRARKVSRVALTFPRSKKLRLWRSESGSWHWCYYSSDRRVVFHRPFPPKRIAVTSAATRSSLSARGGESCMGSFCPLPYHFAHAHNLFLSMWKRSRAMATNLRESN